ncbi:MAG: hypothetical protein ACC642_07570, partial [Pseudomonadales bacterium]
NGMKGGIALAVAVFGANALAAEDYAMTCDEVITKLNLEATAAAKDRFADLSGSCLGVVERDGNLYMHTKVVVRRASSRRVTLYVPATDRTFDITPQPGARVTISGRKERVSNLARGQELSIYVSVDEFTQPIIDEIAFETETEEFILAPAVVAAALPTTG